MWCHALWYCWVWRHTLDIHIFERHKHETGFIVRCSFVCFYVWPHSHLKQYRDEVSSSNHSNRIHTIPWQLTSVVACHFKFCQILPTLVFVPLFVSCTLYATVFVLFAALCVCFDSPLTHLVRVDRVCDSRVVTSLCMCQQTVATHSLTTCAYDKEVHFAACKPVCRSKGLTVDVFVALPVLPV